MKESKEGYLGSGTENIQTLCFDFGSALLPFELVFFFIVQTCINDSISVYIVMVLGFFLIVKKGLWFFCGFEFFVFDF